ELENRIQELKHSPQRLCPKLPTLSCIQLQISPRNHFATLRIQLLDSDLLKYRLSLDLLARDYIKAFYHFTLPIKSLGFDQCPAAFRDPKAYRTVFAVSRSGLYQDDRTSDGPYALFAFIVSVLPVDKPQRKIIVGNVGAAYRFAQSGTGQGLWPGAGLVC